MFLQFGPLDSTNWVMENLPKAFCKKFHKLSAHFLNIEKTEFLYQLNYLFLKMLHYSWRMIVWEPCHFCFFFKSQKFRLKGENDNKSMKFPTKQNLVRQVLLALNNAVSKSLPKVSHSQSAEVQKLTFYQKTYFSSKNFRLMCGNDYKNRKFSSI